MNERLVSHTIRRNVYKMILSLLVLIHLDHIFVIQKKKANPKPLVRTP